MRIAILFIAALLAGCNSSDDDSALQKQISAVPNEAAAVQALRAEISSLKSQISELSLIGKLKNGTSEGSSPDTFRAMGEVSVASFGPCSNMGLFQGRGGTDSPIPLASQFEIYKSCTNYVTSYNETTGLHDTLRYAAWLQPNCQGAPLIITDVPQDSMNLGILENGFVFISPNSADTNVYMTTSGNMPQMVQIQSAFNLLGGACNSDIENRMVIQSTLNDVSISGIPNSLAPGSWILASP